MEDTPQMSFQSIQERMLTPWGMTPDEVCQSYVYLVSVYGQKVLEHCDTSILVAIEESSLLANGATAAKAKAVTMAGVNGQRLTFLTGELKVITEMIRALKKFQNHLADDRRFNQTTVQYTR